jgi:hypothetical protein
VTEIATTPGVLSEAQLDLVSGGMNVQINQISSSVGTAGAGSGPGLLQKVVSLVVDSLKAAESLTQHGHPH